MASLDYEKEEQTFRDYWEDQRELWDKAKECFIYIINRLLLTNDNNLNIQGRIQGRIKDKDEAIEKFCRKYKDKCEEEKKEYEIKNKITDLIGIRIICLHETDIEKIKNILSQEFKVLDETDKTKKLEENKIDSFGYKGLHLDLKLKNTRAALSEYRSYADLRFEVQIRTIIQDAWSTLDHKINYKKDVDPKIQRRVYALAALFEIADKEFLAIQQEVLEDKKKQENVKDEEILNVFIFNKLIEKYYSKDIEFFCRERYVRNNINLLKSDTNEIELIKGYYLHSKRIFFSILKISVFNRIINNNSVTVSEFEKYLNDWYFFVEDYSEFLKYKFSRIDTLSVSKKIKYVLYKGNKEKFFIYLTDREKLRFDEWDKHQRNKK